MRKMGVLSDGKKDMMRRIAIKVLSVVLISAIVTAVVYTNRDSLSKIFDSFFSERSDYGHVMMMSGISKTKKLTVLSLYKEVIVGQYHQVPGRFYGINENQIHSIFPGRIDVGFDMNKCGEDWLIVSGDTAYVKLPAVEILNNGDWYIDEAGHQTPIEEGEWNDNDYKRLAKRANALIKRTCEIDNCYRMAEEQGKKIIENLVKVMGVNNVKVDIGIRSHYMPFSAEGEGGSLTSATYRFVTKEKGMDFVDFGTGGALFYDDGIDDEQLYGLIEVFCYYAKSGAHRVWKSSMKDNNLTISIVNSGITTGTKAANVFVDHINIEEYKHIGIALKRLFGSSVPVSFVETDSNDGVLYRYQLN